MASIRTGSEPDDRPYRTSSSRERLKSGDLSPLQAQIDLALPPNRGLADAVIRVDLAGRRRAGYDVGEFTRVGRKYNMPGGGTELQFEKAIPPQFLKVVRR